MKRLLFCFFFLTSSFAFAQDSKFFVGVNASGVWNSYLLAKEDGLRMHDSRLNWSAGIHSKYFLSKKFYLDAQLNFATKNFGSGIDFSKYQTIDSEPIIMSQMHYTVKQNYLDIPITLNYFFSTEMPVKFFCSLGFTNSFFLSAKYDGYTNYFSSSSNEVFERYNSYLLSVKTGGGVIFPLGNNFYGSAEWHGNIYLEKVHPVIKGNPFQLALGFSVLKKLGAKKISVN